MTSYGGATSVLGSPARARLYRTPGRARTSAIGLGPSELDVAEVRHAADLAQLGQHVWRHAVIHGQDHHRVASRRVAAHLHARDVDVVIAQDRAKTPNDAGPVVVAADQETPFGHEVDAERVDAHRAELSHQHGAGQLVPSDANGHQAGVAAVPWAPALDQLHATARRNQARVDRVDAVFGKRLQHTFNGRRDKKVHVVLRQLAFEVQLDRADAATEELHMQGRQPLGEVDERPQVNQLFGWERRCVHSETGQVAGEYRRHLFGDVKG